MGDRERPASDLGEHNGTAALSQTKVYHEDRGQTLEDPTTQSASSAPGGPGEAIYPGNDGQIVFRLDPIPSFDEDIGPNSNK